MFESLQLYMLCVTITKFGSLKVWKFTSLHIVCDGDKFGSLEVWKFGNLHIVCDDDEFGGLEV